MSEILRREGTPTKDYERERIELLELMRRAIPHEVVAAMDIAARAVNQSDGDRPVTVVTTGRSHAGA
jgi:hypothetical protein